MGWVDLEPKGLVQGGSRVGALEVRVTPRDLAT